MPDPSYVSPPIDTSPAAIAEEAFAYLEDAIPGWQAAPGNLDTLMIEAIAQHAAETADLASAALTAVYRRFGQLVGVPPLDALPASGVVNVTMQDTAGYTVAAGATFGAQDADGQLRGLTLIDDIVIAPGGATGSGPVQAEDAGEAGNNLIGAAQLVDVPPTVVSATIPTTTTGGTEAEDDAVFLDRLTETLQLLAPRPILPNDFAVLARAIPGVYRVAAIDGLKPSSTSGAYPTPSGAEATGQERIVSVSPIAVDGGDVSAPTLQAVQEYLDSLREQTFVVYAVPPQRVPMDVTVDVYAWSDDTDLADLEARAEAALADFLDPALYGAGPSGRITQWVNEPTLRVDAFYDALRGVDDLRYATNLVFGRPYSVTGNAGTDVVTATGHDILAGEAVVFTGLAGGAGLVNGTVYYARDIGAGTLKVSATVGGGAFDFTTNITAGSIRRATAADYTMGAGSAVPVLPEAGTITVNVLV